MGPMPKALTMNKKSKLGEAAAGNCKHTLAAMATRSGAKNQSKSNSRLAIQGKQNLSLLTAWEDEVINS